MELTKKDTTMIKGLAILSMVAVHLFNKTGSEVYGTPLIWVREGVPLVWYLGYLGEIAIPIYGMCTGYAFFTQFSATEEKLFRKKQGKRILRFLIHFWTVLVLFTVIGFFFDASGEIPGSLLRFLGNFFLLEHTYNGAWWFASTYVLFMFLSPLYLKLARKADSRVLFVVFGMIFLAYYLGRILKLYYSVEPYYWKGFLVGKISDLAHVSFFYMQGMILAKERVMSRLRSRLEEKGIGNGPVLAAILLVTVAACLIRRTYLVYFLGTIYFILFHLWKKPDMVEKFFYFFGKHNTNIWLVHMFFYLGIFKDLVFIARYPVLIYGFMMALCLMSSRIITWIVGKIEPKCLRV